MNKLFLVLILLSTPLFAQKAELFTKKEFHTFCVANALVDLVCDIIDELSMDPDIMLGILEPTRFIPIVPFFSSEQGLFLFCRNGIPFAVITPWGMWHFILPEFSCKTTLIIKKLQKYEIELKKISFSEDEFEDCYAVYAMPNFNLEKPIVEQRHPSFHENVELYETKIRAMSKKYLTEVKKFPVKRVSDFDFYLQKSYKKLEQHKEELNFTASRI